MSDELQELEPMPDAPQPEPTPPPAAAAPAGGPPPGMPPQQGQPMRSGAVLGAPGFNPNADKEYYRFLMSGVVMFLGCMMPWGPEWSMAGYKTLSGALFTLIAIGMIWSWWGAIATARFSGANLKWVGLSLIPFIACLQAILTAFSSAAVTDFVDAGKAMPEGWGEFFSAMFDSLPLFGGDEVAGEKVSNFLRAFGGGQIVVFFGALYAEFAFFLAIMGGAKHAKKQKAEAAASGRGARRSGGGGGGKSGRK